MAAGKSTDNNGSFSDINITPFVDVMLVLLITVMISTPAMVYKGMRVSLPQAKQAEDVTHITLSFHMDKTGQLSLDKKPVTMDEVVKIYEELGENKAASDAILLADTDAPHGKVIELADRLRTLGIQQIGFGVNKAGGSPLIQTK